MLANVTLSAEKVQIDRARERAARSNTTLNEQFRVWLERYAANDEPVATFDVLMDELAHVCSEGPYSRDDANTR